MSTQNRPVLILLTVIAVAVVFMATMGGVAFYGYQTRQASSKRYQQVAAKLIQMRNEGRSAEEIDAYAAKNIPGYTRASR